MVFKSVLNGIFKPLSQMKNTKTSLCKTPMCPTQEIYQPVHESTPASNKFNNNIGLFLIMVMLLNINSGKHVIDIKIFQPIEGELHCTQSKK